MVSLDPWSLVMSFSRSQGINSVNFLIENLLNIEDIFICEKKFSSDHCAHIVEKGILILSPSAPSDAGWGSDLYSADKLSVLGHFLTYWTWTSWICSALKPPLTVLSQDFTEYGPATVWTSLLVLMMHGRPCCRWSTTVPVSVTRLKVRYTNI